MILYLFFFSEELLCEEKEGLSFTDLSGMVLFSGILVLFKGVIVIGKGGAGVGSAGICTVGIDSDGCSSTVKMDVVEVVTAGGGGSAAVMTGAGAEFVMFNEVLNWVWFYVYMKWALIFWVNFLSMMFLFPKMLVFMLLGFMMVFFLILVIFWGFSDFDVINCFFKFFPFREYFAAAAVSGVVCVDGFDKK